MLFSHFTEKLLGLNGFLPKYHRMTNRLCAYVIQQLTDVRSFSSIAREVNLSVATVIRIFDLVQCTIRTMQTTICTPY